MRKSWRKKLKRGDSSSLPVPAEAAALAAGGHDNDAEEAAPEAKGRQKMDALTRKLHSLAGNTKGQTG